MTRAVQGYAGDGKPIGRPGNVQGYYRWPGTEQMFSSARELATFLTWQLDTSTHDPVVAQAVALTRRPVAQIRPKVMQAHAWELHPAGAETVVGKNGGLNNASSFVGMIPTLRLGVVILSNQGDVNAWDIGYPILHRLAEGAGSEGKRDE